MEILDIFFSAVEHEGLAKHDMQRFKVYFDYKGHRGIYNGYVSSGLAEDPLIDFSDIVKPWINDWIKDNPIN